MNRQPSLIGDLVKYVRYTLTISTS